MALDEATMRKIARLARIRLNDGEVKPFAAELDGLLGWIEQLSEVDTAGVAPMTSVVAMKLPQRADRVTDGGDAAAILANAPETVDGYFVVPKVVE
ncbi:MAG: Asp-tRNA(Asn)/Glu-tRNA(Gln) amidotransferase subunit GatC [Alphaproteobacteria bacterium]|nr:Asp-tRNA(Asn)/Glu-tRNA(Gln) amidotransferase subunit GatC [Alphaproteobacteria bacterium]